LRLMVDVIKFCTEQMPYWNPVNLVGYNLREAGANAIQEIAWCFAHAFEVVDATLKLGFDIDDFAPRLSFFWTADNDFFEEICKMRAARRMWAKIMRERYGAKEEKSWYMRFHVDTAGRTLQPKEPLNNIARVAIQGLAAVLAGAQSVHTCSYDEPIAVPTEEAARVAIKTQQIINHETGVPNVVDPLGGSYFIEHLTSEIEKAAWEELTKIENKGGFIACVENYYMEGEMARNAYQYYQEVEVGKRVLVGVNKYVEPEENYDENPIVINPQVAQIAKERLRKLKVERDNTKVRQALDRVREVAQDPNGHLMPAFVDAVKVYATMGEIMGVLKEVFGEYREEVPILA
jgi:methylmalonyl-CoA mutase, N-terminal domain